jgi:non-ribosomal peptide synthetase component F/acyl carrier protein
LTVALLMQDLRDRGIRLRADGDRLVVKAPAGALTPELTDRMRVHKEALLSLLREVGAAAGGAAAESLCGMADPAAPQLAHAQRRFWHLQRMDPATTVYNLPGGFRLRGPLDRAALQAALQAFVARHDVLRSRFGERNGEPTLIIAQTVPVEIPVTDLSAVPEPEREAAMRTFLETAADEPMDLSVGPPFRVRLAQLGPDDHAMLFMAHSIVWDGWSFDLLLRELKAHYEAALERRQTALPPLPIQFADFAAWQNRRLQGGDFDPHLAFWRKRLQGPIPTLALPTDRPRSGGSDYEGARVWFRVEGELLNAVRRLARSEGATLYMILLAALDVLVHRYSGVQDVLVSSPLQGRTHPDLEDLIGVFVNTLFFRNRVDPAGSFRALLREVRETCLEAVEHQEAPSDLVIEAMEEEGLGRTPYEVIFIYQQAADRPTTMGPLSVRSILRGTHRVAVDLVLWIREYDEYLDGGFDYRTSLFDADRMERMVGHLRQLLESATRAPDVPVGDLEILAPEESRMLDAWGGARPGDVDTVAGGEPVKQQLAGSVACGSVRLEGPALREAVERARRQIATALAASPADAAVALVLDGTAEATVALTASADLAADTILLPADLPAVVLQALLADAGRAVLVSGPGVVAPDGVTAIPVLLDESQGDGRPGSAAPRSGPGRLMVPVPRPGGGTLLTERSWDALRADAAVMADAIGLRAGRGVAVYLDGAVDQSAAALVAALQAGATLWMPEPGTSPDGRELDELVRASVVSAVVAGSRSLQQLVDTGWDAPVDAVACRDPLPSPTLRGAVRERAGRFTATWGMTEVGAAALMDDDARPNEALGRPTGSTRVLVADGRGHPVPQGVPGELWVGGPGVASGYRHAPAEAAGRFVEAPGRPGTRFFRTGERVRWEGDGCLVRLGRLDREELVNGERVDLGSVEAAVRATGLARDVHAAVQPVEGERRLVAYVVLAGDDASAVGALRRALRERLAPSAVPDAVIALEALPHLPGGGLDERRLTSVLERGGAPPVEPRSEEERAVADVWRDLLGLERIGVHDNFFELGGHSLLAVQVTVKLEQRSGLRIDPRALFFQTLEQVAAGANRVSAEAPPKVGV